MAGLHITGELPSGDSYRYPDDWPMREPFEALLANDPRAVINASALGDLKFAGADERLRRVIKIIRDLAEEEWEELPVEVRNSAPSQAAQVVQVAGEMSALSPTSDPNIQATRNQLEARFNELVDWFANIVAPACIAARVERAFRRRPEVLGGIDPEQLKALQQEFRELETTAA